MNDTGGARCLDALAHGPLSDFVAAGGEEALQVQRCAHGSNDLGQDGACADTLVLLFKFSVGLELSEALLEGDGEGDDGGSGAVGLDPLGHLGEVLVLLANVVALTEVNQVNDGLCGKKEERVDDFDLLVWWWYVSNLPKKNQYSDCVIRRINYWCVSVAVLFSMRSRT